MVKLNLSFHKCGKETQFCYHLYNILGFNYVPSILISFAKNHLSCSFQCFFTKDDKV